MTRVKEFGYLLNIKKKHFLQNRNHKDRPHCELVKCNLHYNL